MILGLFAKVSGKFLLKNYSCSTISAILKDIVFPPFTLIFNHTRVRYEENFRVHESQMAGRNGFFCICVWRMLRSGKNGAEICKYLMVFLTAQSHSLDLCISK